MVAARQAVAVALLALQGAQAGGPQDQPNPDCSADTHVAPADCITDDTMTAYRAVAQFFEDNKGIEPPTDGADCQQLYDSSAATCSPTAGPLGSCTATDPAAQGGMDAVICANIDHGGSPEVCTAGGPVMHPAYGPMNAASGCDFSPTDPVCATVVLDGNAETCTDAGACTYTDGADKTQFCTEMKYIDTGSMQAWRQGLREAGTSEDDVIAKQAAVADLQVGDYCPLFCGTCEALSAEENEWPGKIVMLFSICSLSVSLTWDISFYSMCGRPIGVLQR